VDESSLAITGLALAIGWLLWGAESSRAFFGADAASGRSAA